MQSSQIGPFFIDLVALSSSVCQSSCKSSVENRIALATPYTASMIDSITFLGKCKQYLSNV